MFTILMKKRRKLKTKLSSHQHGRKLTIVNHTNFIGNEQIERVEYLTAIIYMIEVFFIPK